MKKTSDTVRSRLPEHFVKMVEKLYNDNSPHIKAKDILKDAIQAAINDPAMTPEVKETGEFFILLLEETGNSFKYDADAVIEPVVKIAKAEGRDKGGKTRAKNDKRTACLDEIEKEAISRSENFKRYGYKAEFVREMLKKYEGILSDDKAIHKHLSKLQDCGSIKSLPRKQ